MTYNLFCLAAMYFMPLLKNPAAGEGGAVACGYGVVI
ncbi:hypothetical protein Hamer_G019415, partial [Homarus americanus]